MKEFDYHFIIVGGGAAGFVSSKLLRGLGKKVAIIEKEKLGGDCSWHGCVPSKALIRAGHVAKNVLEIKKYGIKSLSTIKLDTKNVMSYVQHAVKELVKGHEPKIFEDAGIDVIFGDPEFIDDHNIRVKNKVYSAEKFIIATGSSPFIPPIDGLNNVPYLTNRNIFNLKKIPDSIIILGGGPIGLELSQALNRLGVKVIVIEMQDRLFIKEDRELASMATDYLKKEGISIFVKTKAVKISKKNKKIVVTVENSSNKIKNIAADALLVAVGRKPNLDGLKLENAGVKYSKKGIITDKTLTTTTKNIYACGDVVGPYQFSHMSEYQAVLVGINAVIPFKKKVNYTNIAWITFTDPEFAHAGLTEDEARKKYNKRFIVYKHSYERFDRGLTDSKNFGMIKVICKKNGKILGAHIFGARAGELIHEIQIIKSQNKKLSSIQKVIHVYPSYSDIVKQVAKKAYINELQNNFFIRIISTFKKK